MADINTLKQEAQEEINEENNKKAKKAIKRKLREISDAKVIVANLERELEDIEASIVDGNLEDAWLRGTPPPNE